MKNTTMFKIEKGIPIPSTSSIISAKYPFEAMEDSDSFFIECEDKEERKLIVSRLRAHAVQCYKDKKFIFKTLNLNGIRCWRTK